VPIVLVQAKPLGNFGSAVASGAYSRRGFTAVEAAGFRDLFSGFDFTILCIRLDSSIAPTYDIINHLALSYEMIPISAYYFNTLSSSRFLGTNTV
jgi:hypothetical protein